MKKKAIPICGYYVKLNIWKTHHSYILQSTKDIEKNIVAKLNNYEWAYNKFFSTSLQIKIKLNQQ